MICLSTVPSYEAFSDRWPLEDPFLGFNPVYKVAGPLLAAESIRSDSVR